MKAMIIAAIIGGLALGLQNGCTRPDAHMSCPGPEEPVGEDEAMLLAVRAAEYAGHRIEDYDTEATREGTRWLVRFQHKAPLPEFGEETHFAVCVDEHRSTRIFEGR